MKKVTVPAFFFLLWLSLCAGCGPKMVKAQGQLLKNGKPVTGKIKVYFYPETDGTVNTHNPETAAIRSEGRFIAHGRNGKGITAGRYRLSVQPADGPIGTPQSPMARDIQTTEDIIIDLAKPGGQ